LNRNIIAVGARSPSRDAERCRFLADHKLALHTDGGAYRS
jgi:hypothetical protein